MNFNSCSEKELWEYVAVFLSKKGIKSVLVGGAVAAIYSKGVYSSGDLDIVIDSYTLSKKTLNDAMVELGFEKKDRFWKHPKCSHLFIEFLNPPVAIGDDSNIVPIMINRKGIEIGILSTTDCVKDRLASYIHFKARECFDQALLVVKSKDVDMSAIEKWCKNEGNEAKIAFEELSAELHRG